MPPIGQCALIAFGSNENSVWGDARETVQKAMHLVAELASSTIKTSGLFVTPAFPVGAGPDYVNAAMAFETALSARELLSVLHEIEAKAGRKRSQRWGQRTLDLDLIALGDLVMPDVATQQKWRDLPLSEQQRMTPEQLILPHPRLQDRAFVLVPLLDVAPDWTHPLLHLSIAQICANLPDSLRADVTRLTDKGGL
ncbi:2-amino-4-hydroxy-6-hydroxymethyldihydropteridine diphosphokinase [Roseobacter sp. CCS2]|uniref:2-amino-4-hydroxy-6- hydroxymethyldihydropteridine diphosphokinase n=1 Tax=Roseobacter sp. CCS2 TaxID=391593 RepID=UPI0000F40295|nr:2-amino-4-hydroxy-6-hydroxymethyldihydropteridine diphosphokinase [Roseobacter sp. CCS2]EBA13478.1 2-amino-4-hydroxy-6-hydroxymethyldihydropteridine pyrophosphokinase [Roseobacter sp. CCS2]